MKSSPRWQIGVCSWSIYNDLSILEKIKHYTGISTAHLHICPELGRENLDFIKSVIERGWNISCGMVSFDQEDYSTLDTIRQTGGIVPDQNWPENREKIFKAIDIFSDLSVPYLSFHFGFLDVNNEYLIERVKLLADHANSKAVVLLMETGQETADELAEFIETVDHPAIGINYDPANMILYGKVEPVKSFDKLKKWVKHIHIKDALPCEKTGRWGIEVPWGEGAVYSDRFLAEFESYYKGDSTDVLSKLEVCGLCDVIIETEQSFKNIPVFNDYRELVSSANPDIVVIATPTQTHFEIAKFALENDINVFVEKPIVSKLEQFKELLDIANNRKLNLMAGHIERYNPVSLKLREVLADFKDFPKTFNFARTQSHDPRIDDDIIVDKLIHDLDLSLFLFGNMLNYKVVDYKKYSGKIYELSLHTEHESGGGKIFVSRLENKDTHRKIDIKIEDKFI